MFSCVRMRSTWRVVPTWALTRFLFKISRSRDRSSVCLRSVSRSRFSFVISTSIIAISCVSLCSDAFVSAV